jgi:methylenetetrahydrofolate reductase (NADPH)
MKITEILKRTPTAFSFEFFPPKSEEASEQLLRNVRELVPLKPAYVSVTYGAGGTTRKLTHDLVLRLQDLTGITIVPHLTCVGGTRDDLYSLIGDYTEKGIENLLLIRGDPPQGSGAFQPPPDGFAYAAELVAFVKQHFPAMGIGVAGFPEGHPETPNRLLEMDHLRRKIDEGADYICTQMFFDNRDYYDFCERCRLAGITVPILAGIMPITSRKGLQRMAQLAAGSRFPAPLLHALDRVQDDAMVKNVGVHWASSQVSDLLDKQVPGIHLYTLNQSSAARNICATLGLSDATQFSAHHGPVGAV